jgi:hypothetical protein
MNSTKTGQRKLRWPVFSAPELDKRFAEPPKDGNAGLWVTIRWFYVKVSFDRQPIP